MPLTDAVEIVAMLLIPVAFLRTFGVMVGDKKQGWALFAAAATLFVIGMAAIAAATSVPHGTVVHAVGAPIEGTETRFGVPGSAFLVRSRQPPRMVRRIRHMTVSPASAARC